MRLTSYKAASLFAILFMLIGCKGPQGVPGTSNPFGTPPKVTTWSIDPGVSSTPISFSLTTSAPALMIGVATIDTNDCLCSFSTVGCGGFNHFTPTCSSATNNFTFDSTNTIERECRRTTNSASCIADSLTSKPIGFVWNAVTNTDGSFACWVLLTPFPDNC